MELAKYSPHLCSSRVHVDPSRTSRPGLGAHKNGIDKKKNKSKGHGLACFDRTMMLKYSLVRAKHR